MTAYFIFTIDARDIGVECAAGFLVNRKASGGDENEAADKAIASVEHEWVRSGGATPKSIVIANVERVGPIRFLVTSNSGGRIFYGEEPS